MKPEEGIKAEKDFLKKASLLIDDEKDAKYFKDKNKAFQAAEKLADTDEKKAILWAQFGSTRNQLTFLLFRTGKLTKEIEDEFRAMPPLEILTEAIGEFDAKRKEEEDKFKEYARKKYEEDQKLDIFKAVCNGMSEEEAKAKLAEYEKQVKQSMGQA